MTVPGIGTVNPGRLTYQLTSVNLDSQAGLRQQLNLPPGVWMTYGYVHSR